MNSVTAEFIAKIIGKLCIPSFCIGSGIGSKVKVRQVKDVGCGCRIKSGAFAQLFGFIRRLSPRTLEAVIVVVVMDTTGYLCIVFDDTSLRIDNMGISSLEIVIFIFKCKGNVWDNFALRFM
jgi:hypothetical protein